MHLKLIVRSLALLTFLGLAACAKYDFAPVEDLSGSKLTDDDAGMIDPLTPNMTEISSTLMKMGSSAASFSQAQLDENKSVVTFQAVTSSGDFINNLNSNSVVLKENGVSISGFTMTSNPQQYRQTVDIAFLVDVTCSMNPTIASAKSRIVEFINSSRASGYHTRMCLSTFGDYTVRHCDRFYDNDPSRPETSAQVDELISDVNGLQAGCGAADPGGRDLDENPLRAILDAENAPWANGSQRFGILITDAGFLHSDGNRGDLGATAPVYSSVLASLRRSQINLFAATPARAGYERNFGAAAGIIPASNGEWFPYADLVAGRTNLNTILNRILLRVQTTYALEFTADNVIGLDPTLPLTGRTFTVTLVGGTTETVRIVGATSNLPTGRAEYKKAFKLSDKAIDPSTLVVKINGSAVTAGFSLLNGVLTFATAPARGANIEIEFAYHRLADSLQTSPVVLPMGTDLNAVAVFLNGIKAKGTDVRFETNLEGRLMLVLSAGALSETDTFKIRQNGGVTVKVYSVQ